MTIPATPAPVPTPVPTPAPTPAPAPTLAAFQALVAQTAQTATANILIGSIAIENFATSLSAAAAALWPAGQAPTLAQVQEFVSEEASTAAQREFLGLAANRVLQFAQTLNTKLPALWA